MRVHTCRLTRSNVNCSANNSQIKNFEHCPIDDSNEGSPVEVVDSDAEDFEDSSSDAHDEYSESAGGGELENVEISGTACPENKTLDNEEVAVSNRKTSNKRCGLKFSKGDKFQCVDPATGESISGTIIGRAGKATGKFKNSYNIKNDVDASVSWVDFDKLSEVTEIPNETERVVLFNSDSVSIAKDLEIRNWQDNEVFVEVVDVGQPTISTRWVVTEKVKDGQDVVKARLVARGFEEDFSDSRKDSPTCSKEVLRIALSIAMSNNWDICSVDIKSAYLQGDPIDREVFLKPPPDLFNGTIWKLNKTVYGLCDAARAWYMRVKGEMIRVGMTLCSLDPSLFYWHRGGRLSGFVCVYVDDFLWAGTETFKKQVIDRISEVFLIGSATSCSFKYIGLDMISTVAGIEINQCSYAISLSPIKVSHQRAAMKSSLLSDGEKKDYRSLVGQLNWLMTQTRPDISFETCDLSVSYNRATVEHLLRLNKLVCRVQATHLKILFPRRFSLETGFIESFSDAAFANLEGGGSQGGFVIFSVSSDGARCPLLWQSRKVRRVVKSTLAAETLALLEAAEAAVFLSRIVQEITGLELQIFCKVDNKGLVDSVNSCKNVDDKRLRIDMLAREEIAEVSWVSSAAQLADCLTKRGASSERLRAALSGDA